jgi:hypothetical protein
VVRSALASDGGVLFVDDLPDAADRETYLAGSGEIVERRLQDGTRHRLVKLVRDQQALTRQLAGLGWHAAVTRSGPDWLLGKARPPAPAAAAGSPHVAGAVAGLGAAEAERRSLSAAEVEEIVRAEVAERQAAAREYDRAGHAEQAGRLRREADVLMSVIGASDY